MRPGGELMANHWQGDFPWRNTGAKGCEARPPVGLFPANGHGLHDMTGQRLGVDERLLVRARARPGEACCGPPPILASTGGREL